ncbi:MAG: LamG domain-containing protein [Planctomycetota bacterium]
MNSLSVGHHFNGDGKVDFKDFCKLVQHWGQDESSVDISPTPFGDQIVDIQDLAVFAEYWLQDFRLIAHWKLDETEGFTAHDSIAGKDASVAGAIWKPTGGKIDGTLEFDGQYDLVTTPFVLNPADGAFSIFTWINGGAPGQVIISQANGTGTGQTWLGIDPSEGKLLTTLTDGSDLTEPLVSEFVITDGQWHHIGVVWDGSCRHLYTDGVDVAKDIDVLEGLQAADGGLYFGIGKDYDATSCFSGLIDDVRIYNQALSTEEIEELVR